MKGAIDTILTTTRFFPHGNQNLLRKEALNTNKCVAYNHSSALSFIKRLYMMSAYHNVLCCFPKSTMTSRFEHHQDGPPLLFADLGNGYSWIQDHTVKIWWSQGRGSPHIIRFWIHAFFHISDVWSNLYFLFSAHPSLNRTQLIPSVYFLQEKKYFDFKEVCYRSFLVFSILTLHSMIDG